MGECWEVDSPGIGLALWGWAFIGFVNFVLFTTAVIRRCCCCFSSRIGTSPVVIEHRTVVLPSGAVVSAPCGISW